MLSAVVGLAVSVLAFWGMIHWRHDLWVVLKGLMPLSFFFGGLVAVIAGLSSLKKEGKASAEPVEKSGKVK